MQHNSDRYGAPINLSRGPTSTAYTRRHAKSRVCDSPSMMRRALAGFGIIFALVMGAIACANQADPPTVEPTMSEPDTAVVVATDTPVADDPTPETTREAVLATAFSEWGSTCLNNNYPDMAPKLEDVDVADYELDDQGVMYYQIVEGYGPQPGPDWEVEVAYTGWLDDGCIFDSSYTRSEPTSFPVNGVIPGWQGSLTQMKEGERRRVEIPPDLAYGADGSPPVIPANATLTFDIILIRATDPNEEIKLATQTAENLLAEATVEAAALNGMSIRFEPNTVDVTTDPDGFFDLLPAGEVTCMTAYVGGRDELERLFSLESAGTSSRIVERLDECLSDTSIKNILIGRIILLGGPFLPETVSCMESMMQEPTMRPLFGVFNEPEVTQQWVTTHFCMNESERVAFDRALYAENPQQEPGDAGMTFVDIQECMVNRLGPAMFFAQVERPDPDNPDEVSEFFVSFSQFLLADIDCQRRDEGFTTSDGITLMLDTAECAVETLGEEEFGLAILGRDWTPSIADHVRIMDTFIECGIETDFLLLPDSIGHLESDKVSCLAEEVTNDPNPTESSFNAFTELGIRKSVIAGDLVSLLFGTQSCGIELDGLPTALTIDSAVASCIVGKIDAATYQADKPEVFAEFDRAVSEAADCAP